MPMGWTYSYGRYVNSIKTGQEITEVNENYECGRCSFYLMKNAVDMQIRESSRDSGSSDPCDDISTSRSLHNDICKDS